MKNDRGKINPSLPTCSIDFLYLGSLFKLFGPFRSQISIVVVTQFSPTDLKITALVIQQHFNSTANNLI